MVWIPRYCVPKVDEDIHLLPIAYQYDFVAEPYQINKEDLSLLYLYRVNIEFRDDIYFAKIWLAAL
jgi:hypothetical protein